MTPSPGKAASPVVIDGRSLTIADVGAVADEGATVELDRDARARMERTRRVVDDIVRRGAAVYGVNTGFGRLSDVAIPQEKLA